MVFRCEYIYILQKEGVQNLARSSMKTKLLTIRVFQSNSFDKKHPSNRFLTSFYGECDAVFIIIYNQLHILVKLKVVYWSTWYTFIHVHNKL
jgi:hypothetical protein